MSDLHLIRKVKEMHNERIRLKEEKRRQAEAHIREVDRQMKARTAGIDRRLGRFQSKNQKVRYYFIATLAVLTCAWALIRITDTSMAEISVGSFEFSIANIPVIFISGLFGFVPAMYSFLLVFFYEAVVNTGFSYTVFIYLVSAILTYWTAKRGWLKKPSTGILSAVILSFVLGNVWRVIMTLISADALSDLTIIDMSEAFLGELPECMLSICVLAGILRYFPNSWKRVFYMGYFYSDDIADVPEEFFHSTSKLSRKIGGIIVIEALVLGIAAAIFANLLVPNVLSQLEESVAVSSSSSEADAESGDGTAEADAISGSGEASSSGSGGSATAANPNVEKFSREQSYFVDNFTMAFDIKLILLILNVAVPFVVLANYYAQRMFARPINRMARTIGDFSSPDQEFAVRQEKMALVHSLNIKQNDEIGELYRALDQMVDEIGEYVNQVRREEKLEADLQVARRASENKSQFLNNMSHEIRTPINAILGFDEMILRESSEEEILNYAADIQNAGNTLLSLVNDILDSSKLEVGKLEIIPVEYELSSTVNDVVNMMEPKVKEKGLNLDVRVDETIPHLLYGDEIRIKQVLLNILSNSVKYTEEGTVTFEMGYEKVSSEEMLLKVRIADTGIGMKEEEMSKLFSCFERLDEKRNRNIQGTGLGMSIVKQLLALMETELQVQSVYGEGSEFSFAVSQKVLKWEPMGNFTEMYRKSKASRKVDRESFRAPEAHILVVDDTPLNLTVVQNLLKRTKVQIDTAESGMQALEMVEENYYDVIFLDHRMPQMDGIETLEAMRKLPKHSCPKSPVIALTANAVSGARDTYKAAGFQDYLSKPIDAVKLERMLCEYLPAEKLITGETLHQLQEKESIDRQVKGTAQGNETDQVNGNGVGTVRDASEGNSIGTLLQGVTGINYDMAITNTGGEEFLVSVLREFLQAIPEKSRKIEEFWQQKDSENYTILVHALKSSARLIGAETLSDMAAALEQAGDAKDWETIDADTTELLKLYRGYFDKLTPLLTSGTGDGEEDARPVLAEEEYREAMNALKEFVEAFDFDSADSVMSMLNDYRPPEGEEERFAEIKQKLSDVDREAVLALL